MKKIWLILVLTLLLVQTVFAGTITRTFSDVTVSGGDTINIIYQADGSAAFVKETIPDGWLVTSAAGGTVKDNVLRLQVGASTTIKLKAPSVEQNYVFEGEYIIDGATAWVPFSSVSVNVGESECVPNWACGAWSDCVDDIKERTCTDGCGATRVEEDSCGTSSKVDICQYMEWAQKISPDNYCTVGIGIVLGALVLLFLLLSKK